MERADHNKQRFLVLIFFICCIQKGTGYSTSPTNSTYCASQTANVTFNFSLDATESIISTRIWLFGADKIAESDGTTLSPVPSYSSRLTAYGTHGISLSNVIAADNGTYSYVVILLPTGNFFTATASLIVQVAPLAPPSGCLVSATQLSNTATCAVNIGSGPCGTPSLNAYWINSTQNTSNQFECTTKGTHQCCATSAALACYSGSPNDFCTLFNCTPVTTTTTTSNKNCERELGCGIGLGLGIPCVITCIIVVIFICKGYTYAYQLGLLLGLGFGITFQVSWIIIVSLISTGNQCKLELGLALGLSSGIPCVITFIIAVIFIFVEFKGFPSRVNIGKGIITGLLIASVIGIIVVYFLYEKLKADSTDEEPEEKPTEPNNKEPEEMPLGSTDKKNKTKHTGEPEHH